MILSFVVAGLVTGAVYGLTAVGLVLTYKTSGIFNFAHGALATIAAYVFYELHVLREMPWQWAAIITVLSVGVVLGLLFERLAKPLAAASLAVQVIATVGVFLIVQAGISLIYGVTTTRSVPPFLPTDTHEIFDTIVTEDQIIIVAFAVLATSALYTTLRFTRLGMSMRAVVENPDLLDLAGTNPNRVRRFAWVIGVMFAAISGILLAPRQPDLSGANLTFLVLQAFGAAAIGMFASLPATFLGGLLIGVGGALCSKYFTEGLLSGLAPTLSFVVLFVVLVVFPKRKLIAKAVLQPRSASTWQTPWQIQAAFGFALVVLLVLVPTFAGIHLTAWTQALADLIGFLALGLLVRTSGQVSLGHVAFLAIGACGLSHLAVDHGVPWGIALILSGLIAVPISLVLAIPAIRLSGLYLALATFGFGALLAFMFYTEDFMFGANGVALPVPRPQASWLDLSSDKSYYYLVLVIAAAATAFTMMITRSRLGRLLRAMSDSPRALSTSGASITVSQVTIFCITGFLAALSGALGAAAQTTASGGQYPPLQSLTLLALIMITVGREPWYAVQAAVGLTIIPSYIQGENVTSWLTLIFGIVAVLYVFSAPSMQNAQRRWEELLDPIFRRQKGTAAGGSKVITRTTPVADASLEIEDIRVSFGGLVAVDGVSLKAGTGSITGLIGPNGAGKTTTFNACSGLNRPSQGTVSLNGRNITRMNPSRRARLGIGRSFQQMELFESLTVEENVRLGHEGGLAGGNAIRSILARRSELRRIAAAADSAMDACGITVLAQRNVSSLSTGQRRLVELARCLAGDFKILLLDEPSSGLDRGETAQFGEILTTVVRERNLGILLVEHDMDLVMGVCDYIYVLDFGKLIFSGTPAAVRDAHEVRAAYLGDADDSGILLAQAEVR